MGQASRSGLVHERTRHEGRALRGGEPKAQDARVDAFAPDLRRYLLGEPVEARPDSAGYRLPRFVGRHRVAVGLGTALMLAVPAGRGVPLWPARQARAQALHRRCIRMTLAMDLDRLLVDRGERTQAREVQTRADATAVRSGAEDHLRANTLQALATFQFGLDEAKALHRMRQAQAELRGREGLPTLRAFGPLVGIAAHADPVRAHALLAAERQWLAARPGGITPTAAG